jgi:hypothetical protein
MKDKIEILGMKELNKGNLIATASIKVKGIIINQMRIVQLHNGLRVDVPLLHWIDRGGHYYEKAIELNNELLEEIEIEVLYEYSQRKKK